MGDDGAEAVVRNPDIVVNTLFDVRGKVALVTGGSRGIGLMIAKAYVTNGAKVYISARKADVCNRVAAELTRMGPGTCISLPADLDSDDACRALASEISRLEDRLHILVNNAGATWGAPFDTFPDKAWNKIMTLNVSSVFNLTRACFPLLAKASRGSMDPSHVVNIGSIAGHPHCASVFENSPSYVASKAAVAQLSRLLASKFCKDGINVNCIAPAVFPSQISAPLMKDKSAEDATKNLHPVGRCGHENDMAGLVLFLSTRASAFITGETICLDGGTTHITGSLASARL